MTSDERRHGTLSRRTALRGAVAGIAAPAATGTAAAQDGTATGGGRERPDFDGWLDGVDGGYLDARGRSAVTVEVGAEGNGGPFAFAPANLWIDPGTTVTFRWTSDGHNVVPESVPDDTDWTGVSEIRNTGATHEFTFEAGGAYEYVCEPHRSLGMKGGIAVGDGVATVAVEPPGGGSDGDGEGSGLTLPGGPLLFAFYGALVLGTAIVAIGETATAIRRGEGIRGPAPARPAATVEEAPATEPAERIDHDEYDPWGTATLIVVYFLILAVMWGFMYFVEFLGNGPTVIG